MLSTHIYAARKPPGNSKTLVGQFTCPSQNALWGRNEIQGGRESSYTVTNVVSPQLGSSKLVLCFYVILQKQKYRQVCLNTLIIKLLTASLSKWGIDARKIAERMLGAGDCALFLTSKGACS